MGEFLNPVKVSIQQFYGVEINDFAVSVATTALWISEAQMLRETERIVQQDIEFLPLKSYTNIHEGNALRMDWERIVPKEQLDYIIGNPPFVGARWMSRRQKDDVLSIFGKEWPGVGDLDYVACWYKKAADLMAGTHIRTALVSTNSITQGGAVANLWKPLFGQGIKIQLRLALVPMGQRSQPEGTRTLRDCRFFICGGEREDFVSQREAACEG